MKELFDQVCYECSKRVTHRYSTSFSLGIKMLSKPMQKHIYNIYAFVRFADEIVDTFHAYDKEQLFFKFEKDFYQTLESGISLNPILNSFITTVTKFAIPLELIEAFLSSMKLDLSKKQYIDQEEYKKYIYGSADVVGLMCLKVFVSGDEVSYQKLKEPAMRLGSAFQKVNFLRDIKNDMELLERSYFPEVNFQQLDAHTKQNIIQEIEEDFQFAYQNGILELPVEAKFGVYMAYRYYKKLLKKLKTTPSEQIMNTRIRISNPMKINLLARSYVKFKLRMI